MVIGLIVSPCSGGDTAGANVYSKEWEWIAYNYDGTTYRDDDSYESGYAHCGTCSCSEKEGVNADPQHKKNAGNCFR